MKACIVENNIVTNVIEVNADADLSVFGATYLGKYPVIGDQVVNGIIPDMESRENTTASLVRTQRDDLLKETDWWATSDRTMTADEIAYRQALRDIPQQEGFPDNVTYPTKP